MVTKTSKVSILQKVKDTCRGLRECEGIRVRINEEAIDRFIKTLHTDNAASEKLVNSGGSPWPLTFQSKKQEINFLAIVQLLNFGSGYRKELHEAIGRGSYETISFGLMKAHISGIELTTRFMIDVSPQIVSSLFELPSCDQGERISCTTSKDAFALDSLTKQITFVLNETGIILEQQGYDDLADMILHICQRETPMTAGEFVEILVYTIPAFRDIAKDFNGQQDIFILKKAQLLSAELYRRFSEEDHTFKFQDITDLTIFADNVVPAVLRELGILVYDELLARRIDQEDVISKNEGLDLQLRALSISACEDLLRNLNEKINEKNYLLDPAEKFKEIRAMDLDYYLWSLGKHPEYRPLKRHRTQDTIFY